MKTILFAFALFATCSLVGCFRPSVVVPSCEESGLGTVCFDNNTDSEIRVIIEDNRADVVPFSSACFEMREDWYDYKGKRGLRRWRGDVFVERCTVVRVGLFD